MADQAITALGANTAPEDTDLLTMVDDPSGTEESQILNYLKATGIKVGLLINFGEKLNFKRRIIS